jgi:RES domain-containing protein
MERVSLDGLPSKWFAADPPSQLQCVGQQWLRRGKTAILKVPSAIIIEEWNYLLNPLHADFRKLTFSAVKPFRFDRRVARSRKY